MKRTSLNFVAFNIVNLLDQGFSAPIDVGRTAATNGRALVWLNELAPDIPATDWSALDPDDIAEIERGLSDVAASIKPSKVGAVNNGVAAILGYTLQLLADTP